MPPAQTVPVVVSIEIVGVVLPTDIVIGFDTAGFTSGQGISGINSQVIISPSVGV